MNFVIPFNLLTTSFPDDTVWANGIAEIIGYSAKRNLHIVINDGQCASDDGTYLVHVYKPSNPNHKDTWLSDGVNGIPVKYLDFEEEIFQEVINFSDRESLMILIDKFSDYK